MVSFPYFLAIEFSFSIKQLVSIQGVLNLMHVPFFFLVFARFLFATFVGMFVSGITWFATC